MNTVFLIITLKCMGNLISTKIELPLKEAQKRALEAKFVDWNSLTQGRCKLNSIEIK